MKVEVLFREEIGLTEYEPTDYCPLEGEQEAEAGDGLDDGLSLSRRRRR